MKNWTKLPEDTNETCDRADDDMFVKADTPWASEAHRCGATAKWLRPKMSGDTTDVSVCLCDEHLIEQQDRVIFLHEDLKAKLIRKIRYLRPDLHSDDEAVLLACGLDRHPRPEPDALWYELNAPKPTVH